VKNATKQSSREKSRNIVNSTGFLNNVGLLVQSSCELHFQSSCDFLFLFLQCIFESNLITQLSGIWSTPTKEAHVILTNWFNLTSPFLELSLGNSKTIHTCAIVQSSAITRTVHVIINTTIN